MKQNIKNHLKENVTFSQQKGKVDVLMLHKNSSKLIGEFHSEGKETGCKENKIRIVKAAAKLLLADIKSLNIETNWYPEIYELGEVEKLYHSY